MVAGPKLLLLNFDYLDTKGPKTTPDEVPEPSGG